MILSIRKVRKVGQRELINLSLKKKLRKLLNNNKRSKGSKSNSIKLLKPDNNKRINCFH